MSRDDLFGADDMSATPSVIGAGNADDDHDPLAEEGGEATIVYLPTERPTSAGEQDFTVQFRQTDAGELALPVFTSLENLVAGCGEGQAWVSINSTDIDEIVRQANASGIAVDPAMPGEDD